MTAISEPRHAQCIACNSRGYTHPRGSARYVPVRCRVCRGKRFVEIVDDEDAAKRAAELQAMVAAARKAGVL